MAAFRPAATMLLLVFAACDDPSVTIELRFPSDLTEAVKRTTVTAYLSESLTCDAIAFGEVAAIDLDASRIQEIDLTQTATLSSLPRIDRKLIVARSFIGELGDVPAAAGCAEVGEIAGHTTVPIDGQLVASVALTGAIGNGTFSDRRIAVDVDQPNGAALVGREVRWTTIGPIGSFGGNHLRTSAQAGPPITTNDRGRADVSPAESDVFGPMVAQVTVAWADRPLPLVLGFMQGEHISVPLDASGNSSDSPPVCVTRRQLGKPTVACLIAGATRRVVELRLNGTNLDTRDLTEPGVETAFSLISASAMSGDTERLYALLSDGRWLGLDDTPDGNTADLCKMQQGSCTVQPIRSVVLPACNRDTFPRVIIELAQGDGRNRFEAFTSTGTRVPGLATRVRGKLQIIGAGCVGYGEALTEALIMTGASGQNFAFVDCGGDTACSTAWIGSSVVTFAPGPSSGDLPRLVGSVTDVTGPSIVDWTLAPDVDRNGDPTIILRELRRTPAAAFPIGLVAGHFDADNVVDLAWTLAADDDRQRGKIQFALAPEAAGQRLTGLSQRVSTSVPLALVSIDLDCDGRDDTVSISADAAHVVRTGIPLTGPPPPSGC